jgi:hypothetical protein
MKNYLFLLACLALGSCNGNFAGGLFIVPLLAFIGSLIFFYQMKDEKNKGVNFTVGCVLMGAAFLFYFAIRGNWFN